jgi:hypothetical protein
MLFKGRKPSSHRHSTGTAQAQQEIPMNGNEHDIPALPTV